jgi:hypothetical protein
MVSVLFARKDSIYKTFHDVDVWDIERNAMSWPGGNSLIAHPPCRSWGRLRHFSKGDAKEKDMAVWAIEQVRKWGGVLEHPADSLLWRTVGATYYRDSWGGYLIWISQFWFGHRADKPTCLYIKGCRSDMLPPVPLVLGRAPCVIASTAKDRPEVTKREREATPVALALWLIETAKQCSL